MSDRYYCPHCDTGVSTTIKYRYKVLNGTKERIALRIRVCNECGEEIPDEELDKENKEKIKSFK